MRVTSENSGEGPRRSSVRQRFQDAWPKVEGEFGHYRVRCRLSSTANRRVSVVEEFVDAPPGLSIAKLPTSAA